MTPKNITMNKEFVWTDDLVKHAVKVLGAAYNNPDLYNDGKWEGIGKELDKFKASHTTEQIERDWEVLSYLNLKHNSVMEAQVQPSDLGDPTRWAIYAVKRFSDNSVFSVGDEILNGKIVSFDIGKNPPYEYMYAHCNAGEVTVRMWINDIQPLPDRTKGCNICGGELALIRGRYPKEDKREVCPTCNTERLEQINEISSSAYGVAMQKTKSKL